MQQPTVTKVTPRKGDGEDGVKDERDERESKEGVKGRQTPRH